MCAQGLHVSYHDRPCHTLLQYVASSWSLEELPIDVDSDERSLRENSLEALESAGHHLLNDYRLHPCLGPLSLPAPGGREGSTECFQLLMIAEAVHPSACRPEGHLHDTRPLGAQERVAMRAELLTRASQERGRLGQADGGKSPGQRTLGLQCRERTKRCHRDHGMAGWPRGVALAQRGKKVGLFMDGEEHFDPLLFTQLRYGPHVAIRVCPGRWGEMDAPHPLGKVPQAPACRGTDVDRAPRAPEGRNRLPCGEATALRKENLETHCHKTMSIRVCLTPWR